MLDGSSTSVLHPHKKLVTIRLLILIGLWIVCFIPVYPGLVNSWLNNADNSHGILVPFISLFFIWQKRDELKSARISSSNWGAIVLVISMVLYLLGFASRTNVISCAMIVSSLIGLLLFTLGKQLVTLLVFPLLFLFFMVPIPGTILGILSFPLQLLATKISFLFIQTISIPVLQEGNMLYLSQTTLEVAESCSGIRSIVSFGVLSVIFAYVMDKGRWRRIVLLVSAIPLALFTNIIRVTGTGILAHYYGSGVADGFLHEFSGLIVFAFGFVLLLLEFIVLSRIGVRTTNNLITNIHP